MMTLDGVWLKGGYVWAVWPTVEKQQGTTRSILILWSIGAPWTHGETKVPCKIFQSSTHHKMVDKLGAGTAPSIGQGARGQRPGLDGAAGSTPAWMPRPGRHQNKRRTKSEEYRDPMYPVCLDALWHWNWTCIQNSWQVHHVQPACAWMLVT